MRSLPQFFVLRAGELELEAPNLGAKVRVVGRHGEYIVLRVDKQHRVVDLLGCDGMHAVAEAVPFSDLRFERSEDGPVTLVRARIPRQRIEPEPSDA